MNEIISFEVTDYTDGGTHRLNRYTIYQDSSAQSGDAFYARMGRFFANGSIHKELGGAMTDSPDHVWLLAYEGEEDNRQIVAFSGCRFNADRSVAWFTETWVDPAHRNNGLFEQMFTLKFRLCVEIGARVVKGLANPASAAMFKRHDWQPTSVRGQWTHYEKHVESSAPVEA